MLSLHSLSACCPSINILTPVSHSSLSLSPPPLLTAGRAHSYDDPRLAMRYVDRALAGARCVQVRVLQGACEHSMGHVGQPDAFRCFHPHAHCVRPGPLAIFYVAVGSAARSACEHRRRLCGGLCTPPSEPLHWGVAAWSNTCSGACAPGGTHLLCLPRGPQASSPSVSPAAPSAPAALAAAAAAP